MWVERVVGVQGKFNGFIYMMAGMAVMSLTFGISAMAAYADALPQPVNSIWVTPHANIYLLYEGGSTQPVGYALIQGDQSVVCRMVFPEGTYTCVSENLRR